MVVSLTWRYWYSRSVSVPAESKEEKGAELHIETLRWLSIIWLVIFVDGQRCVLVC